MCGVQTVYELGQVPVMLIMGCWRAIVFAGDRHMHYVLTKHTSQTKANQHMWYPFAEVCVQIVSTAREGLGAPGHRVTNSMSN